MHRYKLCAAVLAAVWMAAPAGAAEDPAALLARARQAMGGAAWDRVAANHVRAKIEMGGLEGTVESWEDVRSGRYVDRFALGPASGAEGFDGEMAWTQDSSGQAHPSDAAEELAAARNEAYRRSLAYWYPERGKATLEDAGERAEGERRFRVVRITPQGGRPFELWIDTATWRFDRIVEAGGRETRSTFLSDYRPVDGVLVPFAQRVTNGETKYDQRLEIESLEHVAALAPARFALPAPPPPDFTIADGKTSTMVPFELLNNHIYVEVRIDGKGPFQVLCDTGGQNIMTPELAATLGLEGQGAFQGQGVGEKSEDIALAKVKTLSIGGVTLRDQVFAIFPLQAMQQVEGVRFGGLVGYEIFRRFVVDIDYARRQLVLTLPAAFAYHGDGAVVPFRFHDQTPQIDGAIDGVEGALDLDTGSRSSLTVLGPFAVAHGLVERYGAKLEATTGWGVGGSVRGRLARAGAIRLGPVEVRDVVIDLAQQKKGSFSDPYLAGNVGGGVLKRFRVIFDYGKKQVIFERAVADGARDAWDRAGVWLNLAKGGDAFEVMDAIAGAPAAAAGLVASDRVVAVDGQSPRELSLPALRVRLRALAPGTRVTFTVERAGKRSDVVVTLRDLV
ncbi:MAG: aspartyl protease family protein [Acidobacteriota bacterium]